MIKIAPSALSNEALITETRAIMVRCNSLSADLVAHLAEIDVRKLYLEQAHPSLFAWCVAELGCSEDVTCNLITVARASRKWPAVLQALREGRVHLTGLRMLAPHFNDVRHRELLDAASGKSKREIEELLVRLAPKPPVPSSIRKLPSRADRPATVQPTSPSQSLQLNQGSTTEPAQAALQIAPGQVASDSMNEGRGAILGGSWAGKKDKPNETKFDPSRRSRVEPLSEESYKVTFTASRSLKEKIQEAQDLIKHKNPDGDLAELMERGLDLLIAEVRKRRFGVDAKRKGNEKARGQVVGSAARAHPCAHQSLAISLGHKEATQMAFEHPCEKPEASKEPAPAKTSDGHLNPHASKDDQCQSVAKESDHRKSDNVVPPNRKARSRHIPAQIRRAVVQRDGERCSYVDDRGNRCSERGGLEFDHIEGFARTREHSVQGIRLMCRAHNQWAAENMYGRSFIKERRLGQRDNRRAGKII